MIAQEEDGKKRNGQLSPERVTKQGRLAVESPSKRQVPVVSTTLPPKLDNWERYHQDIIAPAYKEVGVLYNCRQGLI